MENEKIIEVHTVHMSRAEYVRYIIHHVRKTASKYYAKRLISKDEFKSIVREAVKKEQKDKSGQITIEQRLRKEFKKILQSRVTKLKQSSAKLTVLEVLMQAMQIREAKWVCEWKQKDAKSKQVNTAQRTT